MKSLLMASCTLVLSTHALAVSNLPRPAYLSNGGCGPEEFIPGTCASGEERAQYCRGFKGVVNDISNAGAVIPKEDHVIWCWTILEDWTQCRIPSPKLQFECTNYVKSLAAPENTCAQIGFEQASAMYHSDIAKKCPAAE
jgi:hypothetical protein